jgi:NAD-dependent dihydropyrimidine dehydrogenase PreA subunit
MARRKIIKIDETKCNGCGECIPTCPEGAIQVIDGKARLVSDLVCDGLGACLGHCPQGAISIEEREAERYDERKVMENIVKQGANTIGVHLRHLKEHGQTAYVQEALNFLNEKGISVVSAEDSSAGHLHGGCPGSRIMDFRRQEAPAPESETRTKDVSQLRQWPIQLMLVPPHAPYLNDADLLIVADCVPFAYAPFHQDLLKGKVLLVGCPKLDDVGVYQEKLKQIFKNNIIKCVTYAHMEVPCCFGLIGIIQGAIADSGKKVPFKEVTISIKGEKIA